MITAERLVAVLSNEPRQAQRQLFLAAMIQQELGGTSSPTIVVGGSAIEIYSHGQYASGDLDLVGERPRLAAILEKWGFRRDGRLWHHPRLGLPVDLVGKEYTGDMARVRLLETPYGPIRIAALEDLIVKRLASTKHWSIPNDYDQALLLAREYRDQIDWKYLESQGRIYQVPELLQDLARQVR